MELKALAPRLAEVALSISPVTRPFAKVGGWGVDLTILAGTAIKKRLAEKSHSISKQC